MVRWLGVACLMVVSVAPVLAQSACDTDLIVSALRTRQAQLAEGKVEEMSTDVPELTRTRLSGLKDALAALVETTMHCTPAGADAAAIQTQLAKLMGTDRPVAKDAPAYGVGLKVAVAAPANAPQLRAVTVSYGIECGDDSMLLLYEPGPNGWKRTMRWQSPEYKQISGAFGDFFEYAVVPGIAPGAPVKIAVAHGHPWCTSRFSGFSIDLLEGVTDGNAPKALWHRDEGYVRDEAAPRMMARPDGFELRAQVGTIETEQLTRRGVFRYKVSGDAVERVQPIAVDGRGFVDAWLEVPWSSAKNWSAAEGLAGFEQVHEAFTKAHNAGSVTYTYGPVRGCSVKGRYEVEMDADPGGKQFYALQQRTEGDGYMMVNYGTTQDERCSGPDLMKKR
jgi:hypothetical protein